MEGTVYVDLFFLVNFSMDFLCFYLTAKLLHQRVALGRMILAAVFGGLYADLALFLPLTAIWALIVDAIACVILCAVAYSPKRTGQWGLFLVVFVAISMVLGGFMTALFYLLNRTPLASLLAGESDGFSIWIFAILALISGILTLLGGRFFGKQSARQSVEIEISYAGKSLCLHALADSGNFLREPMSGKPCIVADADALVELLPSEMILAARKGDARGLPNVGSRHAARIRLIPTRTAAGEGVLLGVRPDRVRVDCGKGSREVDALIAIGHLGSAADGYEALLPSVLLIS